MIRMFMFIGNLLLGNKEVYFHLYSAVYGWGEIVITGLRWLNKNSYDRSVLGCLINHLY